MTLKHAAAIFLLVLCFLLILMIYYSASNTNYTPLTKQQEQELIRDYWDSLTPEERRKLK